MLKNLAIVLGFLSLVLLITFGVKNTKSRSDKSTRLPCHKGVVVFEKVYEPTLFKQAKEALKQQNYTLDSSIGEAKYMKSQLFEYVDINNVDNDVKEVIRSYQSESLQVTESVKLKYFIYENDKNDPGKKTEKSKLYAGYLKFEMIYNSKMVYAIQIDFMDMQGKDITQRVNCAIKTIMTS